MKIMISLETCICFERQAANLNDIYTPGLHLGLHARHVMFLRIRIMLRSHFELPTWNGWMGCNFWVQKMRLRILSVKTYAKMVYKWYCWWFRNPEKSSWGVGSLSQFTGFYTSQVVVRRISEPSAICTTNWVMTCLPWPRWNSDAEAMV